MRAIQIARGAVISVALVTGSAGALAMPALANDTIPVNSTGDAADADLSDGRDCAMRTPLRLDRSARCVQPSRRPTRTLTRTPSRSPSGGPR